MHRCPCSHGIPGLTAAVFWWICRCRYFLRHLWLFDLVNSNEGAFPSILTKESLANISSHPHFLIFVFAVRCSIYRFKEPLIQLPSMSLARLQLLPLVHKSTHIHFLTIKSNYGYQDVRANPLLHIWSLGVEEQYYIIVPQINLAAVEAGSLHLTTVYLLLP
jgi:hypothetical protein